MLHPIFRTLCVDSHQSEGMVIINSSEWEWLRHIGLSIFFSFTLCPAHSRAEAVKILRSNYDSPDPHFPTKFITCLAAELNTELRLVTRAKKLTY